MANEILSKLKPSGASSAEYAFRAGYLYYGITTGTAERFAVTIQDLAGTSISIPAYYNGLTIALKFHTTPYETATLNVNNLGAKPIQYGSTNVAWQYFTPGAVYILVYDKATDTFRGVHSYDTRYSNATQSAAGLLSAADKTKLDGIASGAEVNVQANWNETTTTSDAYIQNKPTSLSQFVDNLGSSPVHTHSQYLTSHQDISGKLDKVTFEYNQELAFGASGNLLVFRGYCYDTNITIDIDSTTALTYHATLVIATQNSIVQTITVYGDPTGSITKSLYIKPCTAQTDSGRVIEVYFAPQAWSKNFIHVRTQAPYAAPSHVCVSVDSIPATATYTYASGHIINALDIKANTSAIPTNNNQLTNGAGYTTNTGTVTSVGLSAPTGLTVTNSPVTTSGTLTLSFTSGYSIPTTAKQGNWDTAYGWGNHASAGYLTSHQSLDGCVKTSTLGAANGTAQLDASGKVPSSQLPSYVDDVLEYATKANFPATGETGKIYVALDTNKIYRWSGSTYVVISETLSLGETSSTAFRGDYGKVAYDHTGLTNNPHSVTKSQVGLGNVENTALSTWAGSSYLTTCSQGTFGSFATKSSLDWSELTGRPSSLPANGGTASTLTGIYTSDGGKQAPSYFGTNRVGCLMSNETVNGDSHYKDWLYMDCYGGSDVGGAVAIGVDRQEMRAFVMGSEATRTAWDRKAELITSVNIGSQSVNYATSAGSAPASDVYAWAKASTKPSYSWSEIGSRPTTLSAFTDDLGNSPVHTHSQYLTSHQDISGKQDKSTAVTHTASTAVGSATNPVYVAADGTATACTYSLNTTVPSNAVFTDHTYNFSGTTFNSGNGSTSEHDCNNAIKNGTYYYTSHGPGTTLGASTDDGALYAQAYSDDWVGQIAQDYRNGRLFVRGKNSGSWTDWKRIACFDEIPTSLPASDVYAWAKASTKPSYSWSEISSRPTALSSFTDDLGTSPVHSHSQYLTSHQDISGKVNKSGDTMTGTLSFTENQCTWEFRPNNGSYYTHASYQTAGNEALVFGTENPVTSFMFVNGEAKANIGSSRWTSITPGLQIKKNCVSIGALIANGVDPTYKLHVEGTLNASSTITQNGTAVSLDGHTHSQYLTGITSSQVTTALGYTPYNSTNPNGYISGITSSMVTTALGYTPYNDTNPSGYVTTTDKKFVDATTSVSSNKLTVTYQNAALRGYQVYKTSTNISGIVFSIPDNAVDLEHYLMLENGTSSNITISSISVPNTTNVFYPDDIAEYVIPANYALELSVIKRGAYAIVSIGGLYKK